ncbi:tRNA uridine(34) 5-carboxymethylaminomethyl modification radical SAM/GNAT enzyme Elp3 [Nanoarchaeota archaeon]
MDFYSEFNQILKKKKLTKLEISKIKLILCKKYSLKKIPTDIEISQRTEEKILSKPMRTISGVSPIAIMTKPSKCPHGSCIYCPGGAKSEFGDVPKSYTGKEPATRRAIRNNYDPYLQTMNRLEQFILLGHNPSKVELIIMGGTFPAESKKYQKDFILEAFKAMNDFSKLFYKKNIFQDKKFKDFFELPCDVNDLEREKKIIKKILKKKSKTKPNILKVHEDNETSNIRCISLVIETRPDYATLPIAKKLLELGCTKIELGIQSPFEDTLKNINRGHTVKESIKATKILKDLGFKITYHVMPGLPGVNKKRDIKGLKEYIKNEDFRPDMFKIYPCLVLRGTKLYDLWKKGKFKPISTKEAAEIIYEFKKIIPEWIRIMRVQRDIPTFMTEAGVDKTNLRQYVKQLGKNCNCIRCREPKKDETYNQIEYKNTEYNASKGKEHFIQAFNPESNTILGFCRLRFPSKPLSKEITKTSALIRELRVYGKSTKLGDKGKLQHRGIGKELMRIAEEIISKNKRNKIIIISGVGAREYFKKIGYKKEGPYMTKKIK